MFSVHFEVYAHATRWDSYLDLANALRPELERIAGFETEVGDTTDVPAGYTLTHNVAS